MKIRDVVLQDRVSVLNAGTWTFNVNLVDPVTEFKVWFYVKNDDTGPNDIPRPFYLVDEVALVDGSEVIQSMSAPEAIALYTYDHGEMPLHWLTMHGGASNYYCIPMTFGRTLTDPEWIFDPKKFRNPQMRITWNIAALGAVGANAFKDASAKISVWAKVMEEGATPRGYLMSKEIKEFASLASGDEVTYLPTDFNIRKLVVRAYKHQGGMTSCVSNLKLSQDEDKWIPFDLNSADFIFLMHNWFPEYETFGRGYADDAEFRESFLGEYCHGTVCGGEGDHVVGASGFANNGFTLHAVDTGGGAGSTTEQFFWQCNGRTPFDTWCYPFGDQEDADDWLKVANIGNLRLILTQASTGWTEQIVVQQAHLY